jgi:hypothetical protein
MKIIRPLSTVFEGARSSKCQQPKIRFISLRSGAMSAGLKDRHYGGSTIGNQHIATSMTMEPTRATMNGSDDTKQDVITCYLQEKRVTGR